MHNLRVCKSSLLNLFITRNMHIKFGMAGLQGLLSFFIYKGLVIPHMVNIQIRPCQERNKKFLLYLRKNFQIPILGYYNDYAMRIAFQISNG